jgi:hypothetical protein
MSVASRNVCRLGVVIAGVLAIVGPRPALASRPSMSTAVVHVRPHAEIGAGRYVSGGGRGGQAHAAPRRDAPPPTTRPAEPPCNGFVFARTDDGRRRSSQSRATSPAAAFGRPLLVRVVDVVGDRDVSVPAGLFHDAHAPPSPVTDVAGLLA